jgi:hypothetical protein
MEVICNFQLHDLVGPIAVNEVGPARSVSQPARSLRQTLPQSLAHALMA